VAQNLGAALAPPSAASSGSNAKAPGSAGGYLQNVSAERDIVWSEVWLTQKDIIFSARGAKNRTRPVWVA
jgi:hypothetical protein